MQKNKVNMSDICELAHTLTERECSLLKIPFETVLRGKIVEVRYTKKAQEIFDYYYDTITNILRV